MGLAVQDAGIDGAADVVDGGISDDLDRAQFEIDLDLADVAAVRISADRNGLVAFRRQRPGQFVGQVVAAKRLACTSNIPMARSVPLTMKLPPENSTSCSAASSTWAAMRFPRAISASDALPMTMPASRMDRPEWDPPPIGTMSVSPWIKFTQAKGTPSQSVMSCAKLVRCPCPLDK